MLFQISKPVFQLDSKHNGILLKTRVSNFILFYLFWGCWTENFRHKPIPSCFNDEASHWSLQETGIG